MAQLVVVVAACQKTHPQRDDHGTFDLDSGLADRALNPDSTIVHADHGIQIVDGQIEEHLCPDLGTVADLGPSPPPSCQVDGDCREEQGFGDGCYDGFCCGSSGCLTCRHSGHCDSGTCESGKCIECTTNCHCPDDRPICETFSGVCYECQTDQDCPAQSPRCISSQDFRWFCVECTADADCSGLRPYCLPDTWKCNECISSRDCPEGMTCQILEGRLRCVQL